MDNDFQNIISSVKNHLRDNDGELAYWGEKISFGAPAISAVAAKVSSPAASGTVAERLERLRTETIGECQRCPLGATRIKIVFGVGNPESRVMFVGEGPGFDEDRQGEP